MDDLDISAFDDYCNTLFSFMWDQPLNAAVSTIALVVSDAFRVMPYCTNSNTMGQCESTSVANLAGIITATFVPATPASGLSTPSIVVANFTGYYDDDQLGFGTVTVSVLPIEYFVDDQNCSCSVGAPTATETLANVSNWYRFSSNQMIYVDTGYLVLTLLDDTSQVILIRTRDLQVLEPSLRMTSSPPALLTSVQPWSSLVPQSDSDDCQTRRMAVDGSRFSYFRCTGTITVVNTSDWTALQFQTSSQPHAFFLRNNVLVESDFEAGTVTVYRFQWIQNRTGNSGLLVFDTPNTGVSFTSIVCDTLSIVPDTYILLTAARNSDDASQLTIMTFNASAWFTLPSVLSTSDPVPMFTSIQNTQLDGGSFAPWLTTARDGSFAYLARSDQGQSGARLAFNNNQIAVTTFLLRDSFTATSFAVNEVDVGFQGSGTINIVGDSSSDPLSNVNFFAPTADGTYMPSPAPTWFSFFSPRRAVLINNPPNSLVDTVIPVSLQFSSNTAEIGLALSIQSSLHWSSTEPPTVASPANVLTLVLTLIAKDDVAASVDPSWGTWMPVQVSPTTSYTSGAQFSTMGSVDAINAQLAAMKFCPASTLTPRQRIVFRVDLSDNLNSPVLTTGTMKSFAIDVAPRRTVVQPADVTFSLWSPMTMPLNWSQYFSYDLNISRPTPTVEFITNVTWLTYFHDGDLINIAQPPHTGNSTANVTFRLFDGCFYSPSVTFMIEAVDVPPHITDPNFDCSATGHLGEPVEIIVPAALFAVGATDLSNSSLQWSLAPVDAKKTLPPWIQLTNNGDSLIIGGASTSTDDVHTVSFFLVASDSVFDARYLCNLTLQDAPPRVVSSPIVLQFAFGVSTHFTLADYVSDDDTPSLSFTFTPEAVQLIPSWLVLQPTDISGTPTPNSSFAYDATSSPATVTQHTETFALNLTAAPTAGYGYALAFAVTVVASAEYPAINTTVLQLATSELARLYLAEKFSVVVDGLIGTSTTVYNLAAQPAWVDLVVVGSTRLQGAPLPNPAIHATSGVAAYTDPLQTIVVRGADPVTGLSTIISLRLLIHGSWPLPPNNPHQNFLCDLGVEVVFDVAALFTVNASDSVTYAVSAVHGLTAGVPPWLRFDATRGFVSGTPALNSSTSDDVLFTSPYEQHYVLNFSCTENLLSAYTTVTFVVHHVGLTPTPKAPRPISPGVFYIGSAVITPSIQGEQDINYFVPGTLPLTYLLDRGNGQGYAPAPDWVKLNSGTLQLIYTAPFLACDATNISVTVTDGFLFARLVWTYSVNGLQHITVDRGMRTISWVIGQSGQQAPIPPDCFGNPANYSLAYSLFNPPVWITLDPSTNTLQASSSPTLSFWQLSNSFTVNLTARIVAPDDQFAPKGVMQFAVVTVEWSLSYEDRAAKFSSLAGYLFTAITTLGIAIVYYATFRNVVAGRSLYKGRRTWLPGWTIHIESDGFDRVEALRPDNESKAALKLKKLSHFLWVEQTAKKNINNQPLPPWLVVNDCAKTLRGIPALVLGDKSVYLVRVWGSKGARVLEEFTILPPGYDDDDDGGKQKTHDGEELRTVMPAADREALQPSTGIQPLLHAETDEAKGIIVGDDI